jgi:hypothetical protein
VISESSPDLDLHRIGKPSPVLRNEKVVRRACRLQAADLDACGRRPHLPRLHLVVVLVAALEGKRNVGHGDIGTRDELPRHLPAAVAVLREVDGAVGALGALVGHVGRERAGDRVGAGAGASAGDGEAGAADGRILVLFLVHRDGDHVGVHGRHGIVEAAVAGRGCAVVGSIPCNGLVIRCRQGAR